MAASPSHRNLYIAAVVSCLTAALLGYSVGFIGGEIVLPSFLKQFGLDRLSAKELAAARSWAVSVWIAGALAGVPSAMPICSRLGRRLCLQFAGALYVLGALAQLFSGGKLLVFDIGRLINGMGVGAGTLVSPIYISEISPASKRGMLMSGYQVFIQAGALVGFWIAFLSQAVLMDNSALQWQMPVSIQLMVGACILLGTTFIPESPRYLAGKDHSQATEAALSWLRGLSISSPALTAERLELEAAAEVGHNLGKHSFLHEIGKRDVRRRLALGIGLMITQNMVGLNALNYYCPVIFMTAGFTSVSASLFLTGIFGIVKLAAALGFMFRFVHVKGNRFWLKLGSVICFMSMLVLAYCVRSTARSSDTSITAVGIISVLMVYVFAFSFGVSLGPISWNVCAEIFPLHINSTCCAITTCTQWTFQIVIAAITPPLLATIGWATYVMYGGFCFLTLVWIVFAVPETRGLGVGRPMDVLFGVETDDRDCESGPEITETTALLAHDRRRRGSLTAYT